MSVPKYEPTLRERLGGLTPLRMGCRHQLALSLDGAAQRFLLELQRFVQASPATVSLLRFRFDFRELIRDEPVAGLCWSVQRLNPVGRRIGIWLLARIHDRRTLPAIASCQRHVDSTVRRRVAQAYRRLGAWRQLREMGERDRDPIVRRIAAAGARPPAEFRERLGKFLHREVQPLAVPADAERPLVWNVTPGVGLPPKSRWFIRMLLERIRRLVRGPAPGT